MSGVSLWRIAAETKTYQARDLSGKGAAISPGRWNAIGEAVVYAAPTIALAVLETAAHLPSGGLPLNRFVVRIDIPQEEWDAATTHTETDLETAAPAWSAVPSGIDSESIGSTWYKSGASLLLRVPSVIVPMEHCVLINAAHPSIAKVQATTVRKFQYNSLFR